MYNLVGKFSFLFLTSLILANSKGYAQQHPNALTPEISWERYSKSMEDKIKKEYKDGLSYVISGSLALAGGLIAERSTSDNLEKGTYAVFQTIGIASIGYGAYTWKIGDEDRSIYYTLNRSNLSASQKIDFLKNYKLLKKESDQSLNNIKAITHGLIAALNIYNATQQKNESIKNTLYFIGGVNLLASASYTFEF